MSKEITTGQDSFLDIVANLVGILIILVVLVSAQTQKQLETIPTEDDPEYEQTVRQLDNEVSSTENAVTKLRVDNRELEKQVVEQNRIAASLTEQRHRMLIALKMLQRETETKRKLQLERMAELDEAKRDRQIRFANYEQEKRQLELSLASLESELNAVSADLLNRPKAKTETIEHYPNPIARTVFTQEIHFRLYEGKLAYVPLEELIAEMKSEWKVKAEKLQQAGGTLETVGPIEGFRMQYELGAETVEERSELGVHRRRSVQFQRFRIIPQPGLEGESLDEAFREGSQFRNRLSALPAEKTTVSIWLYPEGFEDHAKIKTWLHQNKYRMASWPLTPGRHISGGPNGFRTSAQ